MKRLALLLAVIIGIMPVMSCRSTRSASSGNAVSVASVTRTITDETFSNIYDRYIGALILDNAQHYTVVYGDTLAHIAAALYGDGFFYPVIMLASRDIVLDPDKIMPEMVLVIPDLQRNLEDPRARAAIRGVIIDCADIEEARGRAATAVGLRQHAYELN